MRNSEKTKYPGQIECFAGYLRFAERGYGIPVGEGVQCFNRHSHEAIELLVILKGCLSVTVGDRKYEARAGDAVIINPYDEHEGYTDPGREVLEYRVVLFEPRFFLPGVRCELGDRIRQLLGGDWRLTEFWPCAESGALREGVERLYDCYHRRETVAGQSGMLAGVYELLGLLLDGQSARQGSAVSDRNRPGRKNAGRSAEFTHRMIDYIRKNYSRPLSTSEVCRELRYDVTHFCHLFRANFGMSFSVALCEYRITMATQLYRDSPMTIGEIASAVGFGDYCYFSRAFKKQIGMSPREFFRGKKNP